MSSKEIQAAFQRGIEEGQIQARTYDLKQLAIWLDKSKAEDPTHGCEFCQGWENGVSDSMDIIADRLDGSGMKKDHPFDMVEDVDTPGD